VAAVLADVTDPSPSPVLAYQGAGR
jgi:hypothetical protein